MKRVIAGAAFRKYFPQTTLFFFLLVDLFFPLHKTWAASIVAKYDDEAKKKKEKKIMAAFSEVEGKPNAESTVSLISTRSFSFFFFETFGEFAFFLFCCI